MLSLDHIYVNLGIMKHVQLSYQDKFLLAFERKDLPFNSYLVFESNKAFPFEKIKETFLKSILNDEQLNITADSIHGVFTYKQFSESEILNSVILLEDKNQEELFYNSHFEYLKTPPIKIAISQYDTLSSNHQMIIAFHHPLFDGHAQMNYLKDFFDHYNGLEVIPRKIDEIVRFRTYFSTIPIHWFLSLTFEKFKNIFKRRSNQKTVIARFYDQEPKTRKMSYLKLQYEKKQIDLGVRKLKLSSTALFSICAIKALDQCLRDRGEASNPIVVYIPKTMRIELKSLRAFQNLIGFIWMKFSREKINNDSFYDYFRNFYKFRSTPNEIRKVLLESALLGTLIPYHKLQKLLQLKELKKHDSSLLISSGRTPSEIKFPDDFKHAHFYAKGVMHRSPGIGVLATSNEQYDFICIEYLTDAFKKESIEQFRDHFKHEVLKAIQL